MASQITITWEDYVGKTGVFSYLVDETYDDGVYAEILAFIQDQLDASSAMITKAVVARVLDISSLTGNAAVNSGTFDRIDDQAVLAWRSAAGVDVKLSIPAPELLLFDITGAYAEQDVNQASALMAALIATGETVPLLVTKTDAVVASRKGWRKGQKHS